MTSAYYAELSSASNGLVATNVYKIFGSGNINK